MDKKVMLLLLLVLFGVVRSVWAVDKYIDPAAISATASSINYQLDPVYSCNGNGLTGDLHTNQIGGEPPPPGQGTMWLSNGIAGEWIRYEFDKPYSINSMWVWNYNQITPSGGDRTTRGVRECTIEYSLDGGAWNKLGGTHTFAKADGSNNYAHNTEVDFGGVKARYVKITVISNHGHTTVGLSEVRFYAGDSIGFETETSSDLEAVSPAEIAVVLTNAQTQQISVNYAVTGGTATPGQDFTLQPGTLVFNPGETAKTISIDIVNDGADEDDETIELTLSNVSGGEVELGTAEHTYTIRDPRVGVGFGLAGSVASEDIPSANVQVCLSDSTTMPVTVDYAVTGGTATPGDDYTLSAGTLIFTPGGDSCQNIGVTVFDDGIEEGSETVVIELSNSSNAKWTTPSEHTLIIQDPGMGEAIQAVDLKIDIGSCNDKDRTCSPGDTYYQIIKEGWTDWTEWGEWMPGGEGCVDWYIRKTKVVGDITMVMEWIGTCPFDDNACDDPGHRCEGNGLWFKNGSGGPLSGDGVAVNHLPFDDEKNACGGTPTIELTITGLPEVSSYNYQMTSWHNNVFSEFLCIWQNGFIDIEVNGSKAVSGLAMTEFADDDGAAKATYSVPGGPLVIKFTNSVFNGGNIVINGFHITDGAGASDPIPADGEVNVEPDVRFAWTKGQYANTHRVFLGTSPDALQFQGHITGTSFQPAEWLDLGTTYYWRIEEVNGAYPESPWSGPVWSFTTAGAKARDPNPADRETVVHPDADLSWTPAPGMDSHDVYFSTDETAVANATTLSDEFKGNTVSTTFEPGRLDFGQKYYWRIDEVDDQDVGIGDVWEFTVHDGKAHNPDPPDDSNTPTPYVVLGWEAAPLTSSHDVYFGTDETAVANATTASNEYLGNQTTTKRDPRPLTKGVTYYWRIDEVGATTRQGDVWSFTTVEPVDLKVDMAVPEYGTENPIAATHKPGYIAWAAGRWGDLYMHDHTTFPDVGGTGITVGITGTAEGRSGVKCYNMCMDNKAGGAPPNGSPVGEPIANTWFTSVDRCAGVLGVEGSLQLGIYNLPAGTYEMKLYHNLWEPSSDKSRECTADGYGGRSPMDVHVRSLAGQWEWLSEELCPASLSSCGPAGDALRKTTGVAGPECSGNVADPPGPDCGTNVVALQEAFGIQPTSTQTDAEVATSTVRFWTDGSAVIIHCQTGQLQDSQYRGDRAALNAFELRSIPQQEEGCPCLGDLNADEQVDLEDLQGLAGILLDAGSPFVVPVEEGYCGDLNNDLQVDLDDLQTVAGILLDAGSPFIVQCD